LKGGAKMSIKLYKVYKIKKSFWVELDDEAFELPVGTEVMVAELFKRSQANWFKAYTSEVFTLGALKSNVIQGFLVDLEDSI